MGQQKGPIDWQQKEPRDWQQKGPLSRSVGSWGKGATVGLQSWNRGPGPGLRRRGAVSGYFGEYQPPSQNWLYYGNPPPLFGDQYSTNRRQLDILSGIGGLLGDLPGLLGGLLPGSAGSSSPSFLGQFSNVFDGMSFPVGSGEDPYIGSEISARLNLLQPPPALPPLYQRWGLDRLIDIDFEPFILLLAAAGAGAAFFLNQA